ncbi:aldo/keto reductase [Nitzschia inconspicua]|uniref:Aldo/keto reductase n=1 Tax=Nitzschia inconspicua TaxID=303405 RepID=A0A9K3LEF9_9STRA|nr:aldo/keto reductase [Nitzschia inconspicua]
MFEKFSTTFIFYWLCTFPSLVQTQTNLFRGYAGKVDGKIDDVITTPLKNDMPFPLVGLGVGNLQRNLVENMIHQGLEAQHRIRTIDTAHQSGNEREVARGIVTGVKAFKESENSDGRVQVHVVTKIWYTYLGYERTKIAIDEIIEDLQDAIKDPNVDLKVTILIHWPRCYDTIPWMDCVKEEEQLPARVKEAGPPPHLDRLNAWKMSWMALEDAYLSADYPVVSGIGISNFDRLELSTLLANARVVPHLIQVNTWTLLHNPTELDICHENGILVQVYNVMNGIMGHVFNNPNAHHHLLMVANQLGKLAILSGTVKKDFKVTTAQVVLKFLVQSKVSVIPKTSNRDRLAENSAVALMQIPDMNMEQMEIVRASMAALLDNKDLAVDVRVTVRFHARKVDMFVYWVSGDDEERQVAFVPAGDTFEEHTFPGHRFKAYNAQDPDQFKSFVIQGQYGDEVDIQVEL